MNNNNFYGWYEGKDAYEVYCKYFKPNNYIIEPHHGLNGTIHTEINLIKEWKIFNWTRGDNSKIITGSYFSDRGRQYSIEQIQNHFEKLNKLITYY